MNAALLIDRLEGVKGPPGKWRARCPAHDSKSLTLAVTESDGRVLIHCHAGCSPDAVLAAVGLSWRDLHDDRHDLPPMPAARPARPVERHEFATWAADLWSACKPLTGVAVAYLKARACVVPPGDSDLRCHADLPHPSGYRGPALVGLVTHTETGEPMSLHRTWITPTGAKADVEPPRLLLGKHAKAGGVIRLWPDDAVTRGLGIAEGIESALSLAHGMTPVWSCIDAGNMAAFPVLEGVEALTIAADHDPAGIKAAEACAARWAEAGCEVRIVMAAAGDLNDLAVAA